MPNRTLALLRSSIGRKALMALTGLALIGFLVVHLVGNLTLLADRDGATFNAYAHAIETNPLLPAAEIGLIALFLVHIALGIRQALAQREARPQRYRQFESHGRRKLATSSMLVTGLIVLVFLVIHVADFRLARRDPEGLAAMVVRRLREPTGAAVYLLGVLALGVHLWHAFQSLFQTLGLRHPRYTPLIERAGMGVSVVLALGFALLPVYTWMIGSKSGSGPSAQASSQAPPADPTPAGAPLSITEVR
jgi:succinate dehydrogenase / fumarate reductase cytochrome b subunit